LDLFLWNFGHFPIASIIWFFYFLGSFSVVLSQKMVVKGIFTKDLSLIISYIIAGIYLTSAPFLIRNIFSFPPATSAFLIMEVVRLCLKMHSFVKVNNSLSVAKSLKLSDEQVDEYPQNITLKNFFFFLWVPALIYQPSYPRIPSIRWSFVFARFAEVAMSMMYVYAIFTRSILPVFKEVTGSWAFLTRGIFELMVPSIAVSVITHYMFLHCWMNAFAELTRFADRKFYSDWWNSTNWSIFYRKWNYLVHRFIHRHIYWELNVTWKFGRKTSIFLTFLISAIFHEYIIATSIGFYKPILFFMFLFPGMLFIPLSKRFHSRISNIFMWAMLIIGHGILMGLYGRAWMHHYYPNLFQDQLEMRMKTT